MIQPNLFDAPARPFRRLRILCSHEASGTLRRRFRAAGHDAWSCDLRDADDGSEYHLKGDVFTVVGRDWDLVIYHTDCTYMTVSAAWAFKDPDFDKWPGVGYHQKVKPGTLTGAARRERRDRDIEDVFRLEEASAHIPGQVWENPVGSLWKLWKPFTHTVQPYQFGDDASKRTGLRMVGLPALVIDPARRCPGRWVEWPRGSGKMVERWSNQTDSGQNNLSPGDDRWSKRSDTYPGIADAVVEQLPRYLF